MDDKDLELNSEEQIRLLKDIKNAIEVNSYKAFNPKGEFDEKVQYKPYDIVYFEGKGYVSTASGVLDIKNSKHFSLLLEKGDKGEDGLNGLDGEDGADGKDGLDGKDGKDGRDGKDGKPGIDGKNGKDGKRGEKGEDGLSAYEVWKKKGNKGSEIDFFNSLRGKDGQTLYKPGAGSRVPNGGTTGQVLKKASNADQDLTWGTGGGGGGGSGVVETIVAGTGISVDSTDPANPIVTNTQTSAVWGSITGTLSSQTDLQSALDGKADDLGVDDNYVTDAEKTKLANLSGTNTGDQDLSGYAPLTIVDDTVYGAGWDGDTTHAPTKNSVYDKVEALNIPTSLDTLSDVIDYSAPSDGEVLTWVDSNNQWEPLAPAVGGLTDVVGDLTPQLGGDLDVNGNKITSTGDVVIKLADTIGTNAVSIQDSANAEQLSIDSNGSVTTVGHIYSTYVEANPAVTKIIQVKGADSSSGSAGSVKVTGGVGTNVQAGHILLEPGTELGSGTVGNVKITDPTTGFNVTLDTASPSADRTITLFNASDTIVGKATTDTLTNKTLTSPKINENVAVTATATELNYVDGVTSAIQTQMDAKAPLTGTIGFVNHGATAGTSRPTGYGVIFWYGSVEPTNATNGDVWVDTA